ncbi:unnamed protein product, partial [marine sediment metagenome]
MSRVEGLAREAALNAAGPSGERARRWTALALGAFCLIVLPAPFARSGEPGPEDEHEEASAADVARDARTHFVGVKIELRKDEGDDPEGAGRVGGHLVEERRPVRLSGIVWSDREVLAPDPCVPARFVKSVAVVVDGKEFSARFAGYHRRARTCILRTERPIEGRTPVGFVPAPKDPHATLWAASLAWDNPGWRLGVEGVAAGQVALSGGPEAEVAYREASNGALLYDERGRPVGYAASGRVVISGEGEPWQGEELRAGTVVSADEVKRALDR